MPTSDEFLKDFYVDCQETIRCRMETEYKLLNMFMIITPSIILAVIGLNGLVKDGRLFLILSISMALFLTILTIFITIKIMAESKIYESLARQVIRVWKYFKLFEDGAYIKCDMIMNEEAKNYGKGKGHIKTLYILWAMLIMTDIVLILIGIIRYSEYLATLILV